MGHEPQTFDTPDGTTMVILTAAEFRRLRALAEDGEDLADARSELNAIEQGVAPLPDKVLEGLLAGMSPIAAWREYRGLSQAELAGKSRVNQVTISRIENGYRLATSRIIEKLAKALEAPIWSLETASEAPIGSRQRTRQAIVRLLVAVNPKRPGSKAYERFKGYFALDWRKPVAVQDCLDAGLRMDDINWDTQHGFIAVDR